MRTRLAAVLSFLLFLAAVPRGEAAAPPRATFEVDEHLDLRYFGGKDRQTLDVFAPKGANGPAPVVLFVHGGTWMYGDKNFFGIYRGLGRFLARQGLVAVMINYRLSPFVRHPEHIKDVARAFAWVVRKIGKYGGDPTRIILGGHSAGGHLVSLLVADPRYLKEPELRLKPAQRAAVRGVVSASGVYRIPGPDEFRLMSQQIIRSLVARGQGAIPGVMVPVLLRLGEAVNPFRLVFGNDRDVQKSASPISHVRPGLPPFLVLTAETEVHGLRGMADDFTEALRKAGGPAERLELDDCTHRTIVLALQRPGEGAKALLDFIARCAGKSDRSKRP